VRKSFDIQQLLHHKSKLHRTKPMHPSLLRAFQRHQEHNLKHPGSVNLITMKQNKTNCLPSYIDKDVKGKRVKRWWKEPGKKWKEKLNWISCRRRFGNRYLPEDFRPLPAAYQHGDETSNLENTSYKTFTYTKNFVVVQIYQFLLIYTSVGRFSGSSGNHGFWFASFCK